MNLTKELTDPANIAAALAAAACFATVFTLAAPMVADDRLGARLKEVAKRREELRRKSRAELAKGGQLVHRDANQMAKGLVEKLQLQTRLADDTLAEKLIRAGLRGQAAQTMFYFYRATLPIAFGLFALLYIFVLAPDAVPSNFKVVAIVAATFVGYYAPGIYLTNLAAKRREKIMQSFPDALDMLLICVESGMSVEMSLQRVGIEIATASVELAEELQLTCAELSYLPERRIAYENLARRTDHPGVKSVAMALTQAEKYGTPIGNALRVMAKENREIRLSQAEKKAAELPPKLTVPMIVFFLPVLFAVIIGPAGIQMSEMLAK